MTKLTAKTITDTQIRELLDEATTNRRIRVLCKTALNEAPVYLRADVVRSARARVADILNARAEETP